MQHMRFALGRVGKWLTFGVAGLVGGGAWGAGLPLFYYVELASFEGGNTTAVALNEAGQIAGVSGSFSSQIGMHPFLSDRSGALTNLDTFGYTTADVGALNRLGGVAGVGHKHLGGNTWQNSIFRCLPGGTMQNLGKLPGFNGNVAAMNDAGAVVGTWSVSNSTYLPHAFLYTDAGGLQDLGTLGGNQSNAADINNAGQVVGTAEIWPFGQRRAFLWQNGQMVPFGALDGDSSEAVAINDAGTIIGNIHRNAGGPFTSGFIYTPQEGMRELPKPTSAAYYYAELLNETGMVAGTWVAQDSSETRVYRYAPGEGSVDIGMLPDMIGVQLTAMNNHGHIVGMTMNNMYETTAFLWTPETGMVDLKPLLSPALDWFQIRPTAISDAGLILLSGWDEFGREAAALVWPQQPGDLNCDGVTDFFDIDAFILALTDPAAHQAAFPGCDGRNADVNQDGALDFFDIDAFMQLLL